MASFLNQYEVLYNNRRPLNLLDALEQANNTIEKDMREQKVDHFLTSHSVRSTNSHHE